MIDKLTSDLLKKLCDYRQRVSFDYNVIADYVPELFDAISYATGFNSYGSRSNVSLGSADLMTSDTTYRVSYEQNRTTNKQDILWLNVLSNDKDYVSPPKFYFAWDSTNGSLDLFRFRYSFFAVDSSGWSEIEDYETIKPTKEAEKYYLGFLDALISSVERNLSTTSVE